MSQRPPHSGLEEGAQRPASPVEALRRELVALDASERAFIALVGLGLVALALFGPTDGLAGIGLSVLLGLAAGLLIASHRRGRDAR